MLPEHVFMQALLRRFTLVVIIGLKGSANCPVWFICIPSLSHTAIHPTGRVESQTEVFILARRFLFLRASWFLFPLTKKLKEETKYHPLPGL